MLESIAIDFSVEDVTMPDVDWPRVQHWLQSTIQQEGKELGALRIRFCSDDHMLLLNKQFLDHDYFTDILTFPISYNPIDSDIIISLERVIDHAKDYEVTAEQELCRVMVHGVLHMCGYHDHSEEEQQIMRSKENEYLAIWKG